MCGVCIKLLLVYVNILYELLLPLTILRFLSDDPVLSLRTGVVVVIWQEAASSTSHISHCLPLALENALVQCIRQAGKQCTLYGGQ